MIIEPARTFWKAAAVAVIPILIGVGAPKSAAAGPAPQALHGKTVVIAVTVETAAKTRDGRIHNQQTKYEHATYVSSAGRLFVRAARAGAGTGKAELAPGEQRSGRGEPFQTTFERDRLVGTLGMISGAAQWTTRFDGSFRTCATSIVLGKSKGAPIVRTFGGKPVEFVSITFPSVSCTVHDGNYFAIPER